jgi:molecular chaperone GrpE
LAEQKKQTNQEDIGKETDKQGDAGQTVEISEPMEVCMSDEEVSKVLSALAEKNRLLEEMTDRSKRLQADFDNFRRRTRQEKEELSMVVSQGIVMQFLPVFDNFERALSANAEQDAALKTGVEMIYRQFTQVFERLGVEVIQAVGTAFDPQLHDAVMSVEDTSKEDGAIIEELQKGYRMHGKVIRPSMVKVVRNG